ncbi:hypothetical protein BJ912DRAFT_1060838 [Pholiota molesta]|nr:hypothetical protein BJ912DRAFT_1060838 [Pholiota molesta]
MHARPNPIPEPKSCPSTAPSPIYKSAPEHTPNLNMDSFNQITAIVKADAPTNQEGGGGSGNTYSVVSPSETVPTNEDGTTGTGAGSGTTPPTYCVVA